MAGPTLGTYLQGLRQAMAAEALNACTDQDLVVRLRAGPDEAAFRAVLDRHGPMVYRVCRRILDRSADVEDAFQATFVVLVRRGHAIRRRSSLASWLHGVAHRTALRLRTQAGRRQRREAKVAQRQPAAIPAETPWGEVRAVLDEELIRLPAGCREALVLCYLEGRTQDEAAAQLGLSKSTLRRRLDQGRALLGRRLARRGVAAGAVAAARLVSDSVHGADVPRVLIVRTAAFATHPAGAAGVFSSRVAALAEGVTRTMLYSKYKTIAAVLTCGLGLGIGAYQFAPQPLAAQPPAKASAAVPDVEPIDPYLVFDPQVQKDLRLSANQVQRLTAARDQGREKVADRAARVKELDQRMKELQDEINRLSAERQTAQGAVDQAEAKQVKQAIPTVLSREAVEKLRHLTIQRMTLSDVLLDPKVRSRLALNDEQVKKIQELAENRAGLATTWLGVKTKGELLTFSDASYFSLSARFVDHAGAAFLLDSGGPPRGELLKVLTPAQRSALQKLAGVTFEKEK